MPVRMIDGVKHYYRLEGREGRPLLVLIHSAGFDHSIWDQQIGVLTKHFRVLRHDMRGHGGTELAREISVERLGRDVLGLVDAVVGGGSFSCCGASLGAMVSLWLGAHFKERINRLVVCSAATRFPEPPGGWDARVRAIRAEGMAATGEGMMQLFFSDSFRANSAFYGTIRSTMVSIEPEGMIGALTALRGADLEHEVEAITAPTLILADQASAARARPLAERLANGRLVTLPGGHLPLVEAPDSFNEVVLDFLMAERAPAGGSGLAR